LRRALPSGQSTGFAMVLGVVGAACAAKSPERAVSAGSPVVEAACRVAPAAGCGDAAPSFASDVQPILKRRCLRCHSGDGAAAEEHDFSKLETLRAQRGQLKDAVLACAMPPRSPLSDAEGHTLLQWVACGQD